MSEHPGDDVAHALTQRGTPEMIPAGDPAEPQPGEKIGRFTVIETLGAGGMGVVVSARDPNLGRRVAIKLVRAAAGDTQAKEARGRAIREARAMAKLRHPNVVSVYEVDAHGDAVYVAMEQIDGGTLRDRLQTMSSAGLPSWREVLKLFAAAGRGLAAAHGAGMIHRDFKPENVLVGRDGRVLVSDFGLVGIAGTGAGAGPIDDSGKLITEPLTRADEVFGTPVYMPPEQHANESLDARADQFAFCVALYESLYGELPFEGRTRVEYVTSVRDRALKPAPSRARVPAWLRRILARGLSPEPEDRYPSMQALLDDLGTEHKADRRIGATERAFGVGISSAFLIAWVIASVELGVEPSFEFHVATDVGFLILMLALGFIGRPALRSKLNKRLYGLGITAVLAVTGMTLGCELLGVDATSVAVLHLAVLASFAGAGAVTLDLRMAAISAVYAVAFFVAAARPSLFFFVSLIAHPLMAVGAYVIFNRSGQRR